MQAPERIHLNEEKIETTENGGVVAISALLEEFDDFLSETDYRVEYHNGQIIILGLVRFIHELLVSRISYWLTDFYVGKALYVVGSNAGVRKDGKKGHYHGDVLVVKGKPIFQGKSRSISINPYLIVEILSESTLNYDLGAKRRKYEQMETIREIVFVDPFDREVIVVHRMKQANVWTETVYTQPDQLINIDGFQLPLNEVFANLPEEE